MELKAFLSVIRDHARVIAASAAIAAVSAMIASTLLPATYAATTQILVGPAMQGGVRDAAQLQAASQLAETYAQASKTKSAARAVITHLSLNETPENLLKRVSVAVLQTAPIITITVTATTPAAAADLANALAQQLISQTSGAALTDIQLQNTIQDQIAIVKSQINATNAQINAFAASPFRSAAQDADLATLRQQEIQQQFTMASLLTASLNSSFNSVTILDPATPPTDKDSPKTGMNIALGLVIGLLLGVALAFGLASVDDSLRTDPEMEGALGASVVGAIGRLPRGKRGRLRTLVMRDAPHSASAEAFRMMRTNLEFVDVDSDIRSLLVTSADDGDGKSTVAANLALAFAQAGKSTILVDADLRRPKLHELFGLSNEQGLTSLLRVDPVGPDALFSSSSEPNLRLLPSGALPPNPAELLGSRRMKDVVERLAGQADIVILDSSPLRVLSDAVALAAIVDATVLVVAGGRTRRTTARSAAESLSRVHARLVGIVVNRPQARGLNRGFGLDPNLRPSAETRPELPHATRTTP